MTPDVRYWTIFALQLGACIGSVVAIVVVSLASLAYYDSGSHNPLAPTVVVVGKGIVAALLLPLLPLTGIISEYPLLIFILAPLNTLLYTKLISLVLEKLDNKRYWDAANRAAALDETRDTEPLS